VLVPAIMALLGKAGWWFPKWLDRITPNLSIEGEEWFAKRDQRVTEEEAPQAEPPQAEVVRSEALPEEPQSESSPEKPDTQNEPTRTD
jgi:putative drug exporter of the RND superfamily